MVNLRNGKNCDILVPQIQRGRKRKNPNQCFESYSEDELPNVLERKPKIFLKKCKVRMVNLRSGKNCDVKPILVPQTQRDRKRKNPKQCFESDSEDESINVLDRKPKIFKKKCNMCASSFRSQVHLKEHISKHPEPDLFIRSLL